MGRGHLPGDRLIRRDVRRTSGGGPAAQAPADGLLFDTDTERVPALVRYGATLLVLSVVTALMIPIREDIGLLNVGLVYLIVIVGATVFGGRRVGIVASVLGFLMFNFFQVPPYYTFAVSDLRHILALIVFLGVSLLLSWLIAGAREQAWQAQRRAEDVSRLYELSQAIIGADQIEDVLPAIVDKVREVFEAQACWILLPDERQHLAVRAHSPASAPPLNRDEMASAEWAFWHGKPIEYGGMQPGFRGRSEAGRVAFTPLRAGERTIGVLAVASKINNRPLTAAERTVLGTFADQAAVAIERLSLLREAQRAEMLARTDELKSALMSAVSHDLRTPLASITASVTSLMEPGMDWDEETRQDFLQGIYDEAQRLNRLVGNLLDMSRIEGGALRPEKDWYSIAEVVDSVVDRLESRLQDHPLTAQAEEGLPLALFDFTHIDQVLTNLLENAIKYTPPGTPIRVEVGRARDAANQLEVSVEDSGPGVPTKDLPHLFDKFYRVDSRKQARGTGLGLAISKGLVEAHGGTIRAANRPGGGLKVTFTLPLGAEDRAAPRDHVLTTSS